MDQVDNVLIDNVTCKSNRVDEVEEDKYIGKPAINFYHGGTGITVKNCLILNDPRHPEEQHGIQCLGQLYNDTFGSDGFPERADTTGGYSWAIEWGDSPSIDSAGTLTVGNALFNASEDVGAKVWLKDLAGNDYYPTISAVNSQTSVDLSGSVPAPDDGIAEGTVQSGLSKYTTTPVNDVTIQNNDIRYGYYGIALYRTTNGVVNSGNRCYKNVRNLTIPSCSDTIEVYNNTFEDAESTGVHVGFGSRNITIRNNTIKAPSYNSAGDHSGDNAGLQQYLNTDNVDFKDNSITGNFRSAIYVGPGSQNGTITGNTIDGHTVGLNFESGWIEGMGNENPAYTRSNALSRGTGERDLSGFTVSSNTISNVEVVEHTSELTNAYGETWNNERH